MTDLVIPSLVFLENSVHSVAGHSQATDRVGLEVEQLRLEPAPKWMPTLQAGLAYYGTMPVPGDS